MVKKITNLALCGGGFFGYAEVGALAELEKYQDHINFKHVKGVSVGSIVAALYAVGYSTEELKNILFELDFDFLIKDTVFPYLKLYEKFGMYDANRFEEVIEALIQKKTNIKFCTFSQIKMKLTIISTNLNYQRPRFFNRNSTPDMVISKAVRMSIAYPGVITPVLFEGDYYGDGGESIHYPIITFKHLDETIGITFAAYNENIDGTLKLRMPINNIYDYIRSIVLTTTRSTYTSQITRKYLKRSIIVCVTKNISSMQFNLSLEQKNYIYQCGVDAVKKQIGRILKFN